MMRRTTGIVSVALLLAGSASGADAQSASNTRRQIAELEDQWVQAVIRRDAAAFNRLLHPAFVYTEDDRVYTKQQLIKEVTTGTDTVTAGGNEDLTVRLFGNTAIATGWLVLRGRGASGPFTRRYRYTDTWLRTDGRWRVIAAADYLKP